MTVKPCKYCLYYEDCIKNSENPNDPPALKERLFRLLVEGWDCFVGYSIN